MQNPDDPISDESGVGHEEEEAELLLELLSNIRTPKVSIRIIELRIGKNVNEIMSTFLLDYFQLSNSIHSGIRDSSNECPPKMGSSRQRRF